MRKITTVFATIALGTSFALAQSTNETIVTPSEFETLSTGKTLYFSRDGRFFGAEQFYTRRRTLWVDSAGDCQDGEWYAEQDLICFNYGTELDPQCWHFIKNGTTYAARAEGSTREFDILMHNIDTKPLDCKGPAVGA
jgi:hypothetical protein